MIAATYEMLITPVEAIAEAPASEEHAPPATRADESDGLVAWWHARPTWQKAAIVVGTFGPVVFGVVSAIAGGGILVVVAGGTTTVAIGKAATKLAGRIKT